MRGFDFMPSGGRRPGAGRKKGQPTQSSHPKPKQSTAHFQWVERFQEQLRPFLIEDSEMIGLAMMAEEARKHARKALNGLVRVVQTSQFDRDVIAAAKEILDRGYGRVTTSDSMHLCGRDVTPAKGDSRPVVALEDFRRK